MDHVSFTLVFWLTMGWRFEEAQLPDLYRLQCAAFRDEILRERTPVRAECVPEPALRAMPVQSIDCPAQINLGSCVWPLLPGRRRV